MNRKNTRGTKKQLAFNKVSITTHPHTTSIRPHTVKTHIDKTPTVKDTTVNELSMVRLQKPEPMFDKLTATIWYNGDLFECFIEEFGAPYPWSPIPGYKRFENGAFVSLRQNWRWSSVIFKLDEKIITDFYPFLYDLPLRIKKKQLELKNYRKYEKPAVLFYEAEIAFDIVLPEMRYITQAEPLLHYIASIIMVKRQQSRVHPYPLENSARSRWKTYDGTINGKVTYYIDKLEENARGAYVKVKDPSVDVKLYLKLLPGALDWVLRIEVTLQKDALHRRIGKELPTDIRVNTGTRNLQLEDFVIFAKFDWKSFDVDFDRICAKKPEDIQKQCKKFRMYARRNKTVAADTLSAIQIARTLGSRRLEERTRAGKYYILIDLFDE